ncbi:hypothetical protein CASFOL_021473 [Castilleja foliolosa]|uniref:Uncharacterized protein n=1 Tax=Castilleja foliolosa TaxID=1961234 RepID=A0ABD3CZ86_9LAMI
MALISRIRQRNGLTQLRAQQVQPMIRPAMQPENHMRKPKEAKRKMLDFFSRGEQVANMAQGAIDGVKNTLGMGDKK